MVDNMVFHGVNKCVCFPSCPTETDKSCPENEINGWLAQHNNNNIYLESIIQYT